MQPPHDGVRAVSTRYPTGISSAAMISDGSLLAAGKWLLCGLEAWPIVDGTVHDTVGHSHLTFFSSRVSNPKCRRGQQVKSSVQLTHVTRVANLHSALSRKCALRLGRRRRKQQHGSRHSEMQKRKQPRLRRKLWQRGCCGLKKASSSGYGESSGRPRGHEGLECTRAAPTESPHHLLARPVSGLAQMRGREKPGSSSTRNPWNEADAGQLSLVHNRR